MIGKLGRAGQSFTGMMLVSTLLLLGLQLAGVDSATAAEPRQDKSEAFVLFKALPDGDLQRIIRYNDTCAREIVLDWGRTSLTLRELWLGESGLKLSFVYQERALTNCSEESIAGLAEPDELDVCATELRWAEQQRQALQGQQQAKIKLTRYPEPSEALAMAREFPWLLAPEPETRERCSRAQAAKTQKTGWALEAATSSAKNLARPKRGIRELVIAPGTKWCGPHRLAYSYKDLGALDGLDRCCRRHDHCPQAITPFSEKYGLFNYMPFTLSHCSCDERFRTCLKMTGTSSANLIGKIFFNMVQTKCFVLKPAKVCVKRSWWGKCEKHKYKKQGYLRDNTSY